MVSFFVAIIFVSGLTACNNEIDGEPDISFPDNLTFIHDTSIIVSPYKNINWQTDGQYKTALHAHTMRSDGRYLLREVVEEHYQQGFDLLAITDHHITNSSWIHTLDGLTRKRYNNITTGTGRGGKGMLRIPFTTEQSITDHINTYYTNYNNMAIDTVDSILATVGKLGGIAYLNHPGRYTGGNSAGPAGIDASNNAEHIKKYVDIFMQFPACAGFEIMNGRDGDSRNDRILWDNILAQTIPQGRYVWGFSADDSHGNDVIGYSFSMLVMPKNTLENAGRAMLSGTFYAVARIAKNELGEDFIGKGPVPRITNIAVNQTAMSITITAEHSTAIQWISNGAIIASGNTLSVNNHTDTIGSYVRATIIGPGGIAFTQPFGINVPE